MATTISAYFAEELYDWNRSVLRYQREMKEFEIRLDEVIRRNSIVGIADQVAVQLSLLDRLSVVFKGLQKTIRQQVTKLKKDSILLDDQSIEAGTDKTQDELRGKMQAAEKEYVDVKFGCYQFLSGTLRKK
jgi:hypothetical protein